jgi:adenylate cyclase
VHILNQYLERATTIIQGEGGGVDKYMGDAVLGFFLPIDVENGVASDRAVKAEAALTAATKLVTDARLGALFAEFRTRYSDLDDKNFGIGVGVTCGRAKFGNIGAPWRKEYTLIGQPVNQVARVQGCARAGEVVSTRECWNQLSGTDHPFENVALSVSAEEAKQRLKGFETIAIERVTRKAG